MYYEVLWYVDNDNYLTKEFKSKGAALKYYEAHKSEGFDWWVTKRNKDGEIVDDIIY